MIGSARVGERRLAQLLAEFRLRKQGICSPSEVITALKLKEGEVVADFALQQGQYVAGANRDGWHLRGVEAGRDFEPRFADLRRSGESSASAARRSATCLRISASRCSSRSRAWWTTPA